MQRRERGIGARLNVGTARDREADVAAAPSIKSWALVWALELPAAPNANTAAKTETSHGRVLYAGRIPVQSIIMAATPMQAAAAI